MGGLIKLSAAAINQMNIQDAASPPSSSPVLPRQDGSLQDGGAVASEALGSPTLPRVRYSGHPELLFLPRNSGICRGEEPTTDPRPCRSPGAEPVTGQPVSVRCKV